MFGIVTTVLGALWGKAKPYVLPFIIGAAVVAILTAGVYFYGERRYDEGVTVTEQKWALKQQSAEIIGTEKIIVKERELKTYVGKATDADLDVVLSWWMLPAP